MDNKAEYTIADRAATEAKVRVTVPPEEVKARIESIYRRYAREVSIPGFRRGHVPRHLLDSRFGRDMFLSEARGELEREHLPAALSSRSSRSMSRSRSSSRRRSRSCPRSSSPTIAGLR